MSPSRHLRSTWPVRAVLALGGAALLAGPGSVTATATTTPSPATPTLPTPAATLSPDAAVGGPALASMGITTNLPTGVPAPPVMRDVSWLVADLDTGEIIAAKAPHAKLGPASTLKTLTALTLIPRIDASKSYPAATSDTEAGGTRIGLVNGLQYSGTQLFQALLMGSANDAAYALARINGGMAPTLAEMNEKAASLGAFDTVAKNPAGLDTPGQVSSAYDLALIGRAAMELPQFRAYVTTKNVAFPGNRVAGAKPGPPTSPQRLATVPPGTPIVDAAGTVRQTYALSSHNTLLYNYPGTIGVKNGWTDLAKRTYIGAATRGGKTYLITEMFGLDAQTWRPTAALFDWAFAHGDKATPIGRLVSPGEVTAAPTPPPTEESPVSPDPEAATPSAPAAHLAALGQVSTNSPLPTALGAASLGACALLAVALGVRKRRQPPRHQPRH